MIKPLVAIVGRQNVGKSTILNRLTGERIAIVADVPGTTRDRVMADVSWRDRQFTVVDTGGLELKPETAIGQMVKEQVEVAIAEADIIIFVVDIREGVTPLDLEVSAMLHRLSKPVILVANKADDVKHEALAVDFYQLGLGDPIPVSAYHGQGTDALLDRIAALLPPAEAAPESEAIRVAIVGRPNVGKSALLNALLGEERAIVSETPGTTRDALDTPLDFQGRSVILIDTAGIRRRGRVGTGIERYGVLRALRAIDRADVVLLVLNAEEQITDQDLNVAGYIQQAVKGVILVVNKWDLVADRNVTAWDKYIRSRFRFMPYAPIVYTSAKLGQGIDRVMPLVCQVYETRQRRVPTAEVNSAVQQTVAAHPPPRVGNRQLKILYATQAEASPPTFVFFVNDPALVHFSYRRYLENSLRKAFGFTGTPLRLIFKSRSES